MAINFGDSSGHQADQRLKMVAVEVPILQEPPHAVSMGDGKPLNLSKAAIRKRTENEGVAPFLQQLRPVKTKIETQAVPHDADCGYPVLLSHPKHNGEDNRMHVKMLMPIHMIQRKARG
jgi:hypothetical protein